MAAVRMAGSDHLRPRFAGDLVQMIFPAAGLRRDVAFHAGPIDLVDPPFFKLFAELARSAKVLAKNDRAGCRTVQSMRHTEVSPVGTTAAAQVRLDAELQAIDPRRGLRQNARRLVDHQAPAM